VLFLALLHQAASAQDFDRLAAQAVQARAAGRLDDAAAFYRDALRLRPQWGEGWFYLGTLLYDRDDYAGAAEALKQATEFSPQVGTAWAMRGLSEFKLGRYDDALRSIRRGRQLGLADNPQLRNVVFYHEGLLLLGKGDFDAAQQTLALLVKEGVENEDLTAALGLAALRLSPAQLPQADAATREAVARVGRAQHLAAQKKFDEATREYERIIADFPKTPGVYLAFGQHLIAANDDERAVIALRREIERDPNHLLAHLLIADARLRLKDFAAGLPFAEKAVKLRPQLPLARYLLGSLLLETGRTARAVTELETARRLMPDEPKIHFALGRAYARAGRKEEAERARAAFERLTKQAAESAQKAQPL
jgi:tetratricopeptide (TPR) repeat protein